MKLAKVSLRKAAPKPVAVAILFLLCLTAFAKKPQYPARPEPNHLLNDYVGIISQGDASRLERKLTRFDNNTSTQICMVIMNTIKGADIGQYAAELGERWGIGQADGKDNGVVVLVSVKERKMFIATGAGTEKYLTDELCGQIIDEVIKPEFKKGNYYTGLDKAADEMINILDGAFDNSRTAGYSSSSNTTASSAYQATPAATTTTTKSDSSSSGIGGGAILFIIVVLCVLWAIGKTPLPKGAGTYSSSGYSRPSRTYSTSSIVTTGAVLGALSSITRNRSSSNNSSSSSYSSSSYSSSNDDDDSNSSSRKTSFGGGKFNGGGAGGSW